MLRFKSVLLLPWSAFWMSEWAVLHMQGHLSHLSVVAEFVKLICGNFEWDVVQMYSRAVRGAGESGSDKCRLWEATIHFGAFIRLHRPFVTAVSLSGHCSLRLQEENWFVTVPEVCVGGDTASHIPSHHQQAADEGHIGSNVYLTSKAVVFHVDTYLSLKSLKWL